MSHCVEYQGQPMSLRELASVVGLEARTIQHRYSVGDRDARLIRPISQGARRDLAHTSKFSQELHVKPLPMPRGGKLLSAEESMRLAVVYSVEREQLIAHIVKRLQAEERLRHRGGQRK